LKTSTVGQTTLTLEFFMTIQSVFRTLRTWGFFELLTMYLVAHLPIVAAIKATWLRSLLIGASAAPLILLNNKIRDDANHIWFYALFGLVASYIAF
jgi:hypothetical protein